MPTFSKNIQFSSFSSVEELFKATEINRKGTSLQDEELTYAGNLEVSKVNKLQFPWYSRLSKSFKLGAMKELADLLNLNPALNHLDLSANSLGNDELKVLAGNIEDYQEFRNGRYLESEYGNQRLRVFDLRKNRIDDEGAEDLKKLFKMERLKDLDLSGNNIGDEGARALSEVVGRKKLIRDTEFLNLDLSNNNIASQGALDMFDELTHSNYYFPTVDLRGNPADEDLRCRKIVEALRDSGKMQPYRAQVDKVLGHCGRALIQEMELAKGEGLLERTSNGYEKLPSHSDNFKDLMRMVILKDCTGKDIKSFVDNFITFYKERMSKLEGGCSVEELPSLREGFRQVLSNNKVMSENFDKFCDFIDNSKISHMPISEDKYSVGKPSAETLRFRSSQDEVTRRVNEYMKTIATEGENDERVVRNFVEAVIEQEIKQDYKGKSL
jgi:hypothetical protein